MYNILIVAGNTFREAVRRKILHALLILTLIIIAATSMFSFFELGVQVKFLKDMSLAVISLFGMLITIVVAVNQIPREIEWRTIYPLLAKPVKRGEFLLGKFLGCIWVIFLNVGLMSLEFMVILYSKENLLDIGILQAIFLIFIELILFLSIIIFFSTVTSVPANSCISLFVYILGHMKSAYLNYLISRSEGIKKFIAKSFYYLLPNLENFNIKEAIIHNATVSVPYILKAISYCAVYTTIFLILALFFFGKKEL